MAKVIGGVEMRNFIVREIEKERDWINKEIKEIGSGLNARRKKRLRLLQDPTYGTIIVEHRDRLMRVGFEFVESALQATNRRIVLLNDEACQDDLVQDMSSADEMYTPEF